MGSPTLRALLVSTAVAVVWACADPEFEDFASADYEAARASGTAQAYRAFLVAHGESRQASEVRALLDARLPAALEGFDAVFPSDIAYSCHLEAGDDPQPIPDRVIAYVAKPGASISWEALAARFEYDAPFAMRPAIDAAGPVGLGRNSEGQAIRSGKRCINRVQYEGDTVNIPGGLRFAPGGTRSGPRRDDDPIGDQGRRAAPRAAPALARN
jgi:hypothetical protein